MDLNKLFKAVDRGDNNTAIQLIKSKPYLITREYSHLAWFRFNDMNFRASDSKIRKTLPAYAIQVNNTEIFYYLIFNHLDVLKKNDKVFLFILKHLAETNQCNILEDVLYRCDEIDGVTNSVDVFTIRKLLGLTTSNDIRRLLVDYDRTCTRRISTSSKSPYYDKSAFFQYLRTCYDPKNIDLETCDILLTGYPEALNADEHGPRTHLLCYAMTTFTIGVFNDFELHRDQFLKFLIDRGSDPVLAFSKFSLLDIIRWVDDSEHAGNSYTSGIKILKTYRPSLRSSMLNLINLNRGDLSIQPAPLICR